MGVGMWFDECLKCRPSCMLFVLFSFPEYTIVTSFQRRALGYTRVLRRYTKATRQENNLEFMAKIIITAQRTRHK